MKKVSQKVIFIAFLQIFLIFLGVKSAYASAVNDYIKSNNLSPVGESVNLQISMQDSNANGGIGMDYPGGKPYLVIIHEVATEGSTIDNEIAFMVRNQENAFVHSFVDANSIKTIADTSKKAWGAGPFGNHYGIQIEQTRERSKLGFAKQIANLASWTADQLIKYNLGAPKLVSESSKDLDGNLASHKNISYKWGGTDHVDPDWYWDNRGRTYFGETYDMGQFRELVDYYYQQRANPPKVISTSVEGNPSIGKFSVRVKTNNVPNMEVKVPIWSNANGQRDLYWYPARKVADGEYVADFDGSHHDYYVGDYSIHAYAYANNKTSAIAVSNKLAVAFGASPQITSASVEGDPLTGKFSVRVKTNNIDGLTVKVPIWSNANGQRDLYWYPARKVADGEYVADFDGSHHDYYVGDYSIHAYAYANNKTSAIAVSNKLAVAFGASPQITSASVEGDPLTGKFSVRVKTNNIDGLTVKVPIWSNANGQRDLYWYPARKVADGEYVADFDGSHHDYYVGDYSIHAYAYANNKTSAIAVSNKLAIAFGASPQITSASVEGDPLTGKFSVRVKTNNIDGLTVKVPIWSNANGQRDLYWYPARKVADGEYVADFDGSHHDYYVGDYSIHAYAYANNKTSAIAVSNKLAVAFGASPQITSASVEGDPLTGKFSVRVKTNNIDGLTVKVPIWSNANGQRDLYWYPARKVADGEYVADFDGSHHDYYVGDYSIHAYAYANNKTSAIAVSNKLAVAFGTSTEGGSAKTPEFTLPNLSADQKVWFDKTYPAAMKLAKEKNLYASIMMSQAIAESAWGQSELAKNANNLFGVKADSSWTGEYYEKDTLEYVDGKQVTVKAKFRKYSSMAESLEDYTKKIIGSPDRYKNVLRSNAPTYADAAHALQEGGYATDPNYATSLINRINNYKLNALD
ncbi:GBS Bsp-like repeat-containing protein [Streptococcaceae bacterium ESL0687]|nr:GBS Bsp-like repeat-containing protein [Streptococcaceae bacterium ESL0687]